MYSLDVFFGCTVGSLLCHPELTAIVHKLCFIMNCIKVNSFDRCNAFSCSLIILLLH